MNIRPATKADEPVLRELWEQFESELPAPPEDVETWEQEWQDVAADIDGRGAVYLAENDDGVLGGARAKTIEGDVWYVVFAYVRPEARRRGVLKALLRELVREGRERGSSRVTLDVLAVNEVGVAAWRRLGFQDDKYYLATTVDDLESRLGEVDTGPSVGALYVQTDDSAAVERMVAKYLPRIGRSESTTVVRSRRTAGRAWTTSSAAATRRRCAASSRELSAAMGAIVLTLGVEGGAVVRYILWDRGGIADEYVSLPEHHGPLPPGDVVALAANPTVARAADRRGPCPRPGRGAHGESVRGAPARERARRRDRRGARGSVAGVITLYDAERCPYCARVRIALAEKGIEHEVVAIDLSDRPGLALREEPARQGAGDRGGRVRPARVGGDHGLPGRALPGAAAAAGRPGGARARAAPGLALRRPARRRLLRLPPRRPEPARGASGRARPRAPAVRRHRLHPVGDPGEAHARGRPAGRTSMRGSSAPRNVPRSPPSSTIVAALAT